MFCFFFVMVWLGFVWGSSLLWDTTTGQGAGLPVSKTLVGDSGSFSASLAGRDPNGKPCMFLSTYTCVTQYKYKKPTLENTRTVQIIYYHDYINMISCYILENWKKIPLSCEGPLRLVPVPLSGPAWAAMRSSANLGDQWNPCCRVSCKCINAQEVHEIFKHW